MSVYRNESYQVVLNNAQCTIVANDKTMQKPVAIIYPEIENMPEWIKKAVSILSCANKNQFVADYGTNHGDGQYTIIIKGEL